MSKGLFIFRGKLRGSPGAARAGRFPPWGIWPDPHEKRKERCKMRDPAALLHCIAAVPGPAQAAAVFQKARLLILYNHSREYLKIYIPNLLTFKKQLDTIQGVKRSLDYICSMKGGPHISTPGQAGPKRSAHIGKSFKFKAFYFER